MTLGTDLQCKFQILSTGKKGEVSLFRALIEAFNSLGPNTLAREFHGQRHQVTFQQCRGAGRDRPRCEICDLLIIQYPDKKPENARLTFNQAKVTLNPILGGKNSGKFSANLEQWDLLANRPIISPATTTFNPPDHLLSGALLPSVGSFGVFYPKNGSYDFAYFIAELLHPVKNNASRSGTLKWIHRINKCRNIKGYPEMVGASCLKTFGFALQQGVVGTPVKHYLNQSSGAKKFVGWLEKILIDLREISPNSNIPVELIEAFKLRNKYEEYRGGDDSVIRAVVIFKTSKNE